jgi:hypothetical protein
MYRRILILCCVLIVVFTQSGCIGLSIYEPVECYTDPPTVHIRDIFTTKNKILESPNSTKEEFLKEWGKPDEVVTKSDNVEEWVYHKNLWCGVLIYFIFIPGPLILPVCDGFERIEFQGNEAKSIHVKRSIPSINIMIIPPAFEKGRPCI